MYQYFINTDDKDIIKFLKQFTFLTQEEINIYEKQVNNEPETREAQKTLAKFIVELIHGKTAVLNCEKISNALFYGDFKKLSKLELEEGLNDVPSFQIQNLKEINLIDLLILGKISPSKRQAKEDIENKAISINGEVKSDIDFKLIKSNTLFNKYLIIRRGKKNYFLCT
jgi:tyrosyl-tRNA synthetase